MPSTKVFLRRRIALVAIILLALGVGGLFARDSIRSWYEISTGADFAGSGSGEVVVTVLPGESGEEIAQSLVSSGVTASFAPTYRALLATDGLFFPGDYSLKKGMNAKLAVDALRDSANRVEKRALIKEGYRASQIFKVLSELDSLGVPASRIHETLTLASVIQREGQTSSDFKKMSRTFLNRIDIGMPLQSDATVSYAFDGNTFLTTDEERADPNPWNTYKYPGLPIGPIASPGSSAIDAALNPDAGPWLYFCTVNLKTGETEFNETYAGHNRSVAKLRAWLRENPDWK